LPILRQWLQHCDSSHSCCRKSILTVTNDSNSAPARIIDVGTEDCNPRLLLTANIDPHTKNRWQDYAALSYCWGNAGDKLTTTMSTLEDFMKGIPLTRLPKTLQDAIELTRKLNLRWLWVDSLCILQDDPKDWSRESAKVCTIYENPYVTIVATATSNGNDGLKVVKSSSSPIYSIQSRFVHQTTAQTPHGITYLRRGADYERSHERSSLWQRGWVIQEMIISRRTIHFAHDQVNWSCRKSNASEDGFLSETFRPLQDRLKGSTHVATIQWWSWVERYSRGQLTRSSDKLSAFAGLNTFRPYPGTQAARRTMGGDAPYGPSLAL
jgi:hypothetical protein